MMIRARIRSSVLAAGLLVVGCGGPERGPVAVSAIGDAPKLINPNLQPASPPTAFLLAATAQGLVRFDPSGQVEPALAQSWTITDDGLSYIFRINRLKWANGEPITAAQVAARLQAAGSRPSRNPLKPLLGAVAEILPMTERVVEIRLKAPRPNFLQLLAQPEMAIIRNGEGTGPYAAKPAEDGSLELRPRDRDEEEQSDVDTVASSSILLRGERAALAVARFRAGGAALVIGGTAGDLPVARAAELPNQALRFDPVAGLFGLEFAPSGPLLSAPDVRRALSMAIDRTAIASAMGVPNLAPRAALIPTGIEELPNPTAPGWAADTLAARRTAAATIIDRASVPAPTIRVAMPDLPGYRLVFAHLKRDWRAIGITAERVGPGERADLRLVDAVAPAGLATWYLRRFTCSASRICSVEADERLEAARNTLFPAERQRLLGEADRLLMEQVPFIPIMAPVRWSLVSQRLDGVRPNPFAQHFAGALVAAPR